MAIPTRGVETKVDLQLKLVESKEKGTELNQRVVHEHSLPPITKTEFTLGHMVSGGCIDTLRI